MAGAIRPNCAEKGTPTLRMQFPTSLESAYGRYEVPFGSIDRELNQGHLERLGISSDILAVSSTVYASAMKTGKSDLLTDSGYPELISYIKSTIVDRAIDTQVEAAAGRPLPIGGGVRHPPLSSRLHDRSHMNLFAFAASSSRHSINKQLVGYATRLLEDGGLIANVTVDSFDLSETEIPLYSIDREKADGIHPGARDFYDRIGRADGLLISFAEHNGSYTAAYKNLYDWASRIDKRVFQGKPTVMLSTSIGARGGSNVLATAVAAARFFGNDVKASLSVPSFRQSFDEESLSLSDPTLDAQFRAALSAFSTP